MRERAREFNHPRARQCTRTGLHAAQRARIIAAMRHFQSLAPSLVPSVAGALALMSAALPAAAATPIAGRYLTADGSGVIQVGPCGASVCGRLVTILKSKPGAAKTDVNNGDAALRQRPILGISILSGFTDKGKDWRGQIYDPRNGKTYKSIVTREGDGTLNVKGCIAFFCQTQRWTPAR